jgi:hypothetical protein
MIVKSLRQFRFSLSLLLLIVGTSAQAQSAHNVYAQLNRSVGIVIVSTFEGQLIGSGSAVTVASQTMVTNRHVLLPGHRYQVYVNGGLYEAYMTICDSTQDLCLMEVRNLEAKPVEFGDASKLNVGDAVYTLGAPNEIANIVGVAAVTKQKSFSPPQLTLSNGLITALRPLDDGHIIQTNAAISPGSSGGGLFDANGRLIGITTFQMRSGQGLNMALPVNWVERLGVSGAPRSAEPLGQPRPAFRANNSTNVTALESEPSNQLQSDAGSTPTIDSTRKSTTSSDTSPIQYWWIAIPLALIMFYMIRRRGSQDEDDYYESSPAAPAAIDPQLQAFLDQATQELDQDQPEQALWQFVLADKKGNVAAARQSYIERRAARLLSAEKDKQWAAVARQSQTT